MDKYITHIWWIIKILSHGDFQMKSRVSAGPYSGCNVSPMKIGLIIFYLEILFSFAHFPILIFTIFLRLKYAKIIKSNLGKYWSLSF